MTANLLVSKMIIPPHEIYATPENAYIEFVPSALGGLIYNGQCSSSVVARLVLSGHRRCTWPTRGNSSWKIIGRLIKKNDLNKSSHMHAHRWDMHIARSKKAKSDLEVLCLGFPYQIIRARARRTRLHYCPMPGDIDIVGRALNDSCCWLWFPLTIFEQTNFRHVKPRLLAEISP